VDLEVADDGPGIPDDERERVFEPFHRGRSPAGGQVAGSGLGLAISRELARAHGGELSLVDRDDWSTVFLLFMPRRSGEGDSQ
jgi:signal transduction histidine kinase